VQNNNCPKNDQIKSQTSSKRERQRWWRSGRSNKQEIYGPGIISKCSINSFICQEKIGEGLQTLVVSRRGADRGQCYLSGGFKPLVVATSVVKLSVSLWTMDGGKNATKISVPENAKPLKVSRFKSEIQSKQPLTSKTVLGEVKEVTHSPAAPLVVRDIISFSSNGFPKPKLSSTLNLGISKPKTQSQSESRSVEQKNEPRKTFEQDEFRPAVIADDDYDDNMKKIMSMSPEEAEASIAQLSTMFSSENLDFLRSRGGSQNRVPAAKGKVKNSPSSLVPSVPTVTMDEDQKGYIAKDAHELEAQVKAAPSHVRRALQWTLEDDDEAFENYSTNSEKPTQQSTSGRPLLPSLRFDLQGCRIIRSGLSKSSTGTWMTLPEEQVLSNSTTSTAREWIEIFQKSFLGRFLSFVEIQKVVISCLTMLLESGFVVEIGVNDDGSSQWIPELEHHEFDQGAPGYNLLETCEVCLF
jgi:hypothetical protein